MANNSNIIFTFNSSAVGDTKLQISCPENASISFTTCKTESATSSKLLHIDNIPFDDILVGLDLLASMTRPEYKIDKKHTKMLFEASEKPLSQCTTIECVLEPKAP